MNRSLDPSIRFGVSFIASIGLSPSCSFSSNFLHNDLLYLSPPLYFLTYLLVLLNRPCPFSSKLVCQLCHHSKCQKPYTFLALFHVLLFHVLGFGINSYSSLMSASLQYFAPSSFIHLSTNSVYSSSPSLLHLLFLHKKTQLSEAE